MACMNALPDCGIPITTQKGRVAKRGLPNVCYSRYNLACGAAMALKTAVAPCAPMREEKQPRGSTP